MIFTDIIVKSGASGELYSIKYCFANTNHGRHSVLKKGASVAFIRCAVMTCLFEPWSGKPLLYVSFLAWFWCIQEIQGLIQTLYLKYLKMIIGFSGTGFSVVYYSVPRYFNGCSSDNELLCAGFYWWIYWMLSTPGKKQCSGSKFVDKFLLLSSSA